MLDLAHYYAKSQPPKTLQEHTQDTLYRAKQLKDLGYIDEFLYRLLVIACQYHDYGKVNILFQQRINHKKKFDKQKEIAHNVLSLYFLPINLEEYSNETDYVAVAYAILEHHQYSNNIHILENREQDILNLLAEFEIEPVEHLYLVQDLAAIRDNDDAYPLAIQLKGLLHKCDYSASAELEIEYPNDFLNQAMQNMMVRWQAVDGTKAWNALQQYCLANQEKNVVITAPTGMGKTEASLLWLGNHKGFYILPLRTAINAIYDRVRKGILEQQHIDCRVGLLHSESLSYQLNQSMDEQYDLLEYQEKSKQLSMPLTISTLDQIFDFVLKYPTYELKLATLAYSKIIIDEIQAYSPDLLAYLMRGIHQLTALGGKFAIFTATLPPFIEDLLQGKNKDVFYERATFTSQQQRHHLNVLEKMLTGDDVLEYYNKHSDCKILVVCNTIKKAQEIYTQLVQQGVEHIHLLHSKFIKSQRREKEIEILAHGKLEYQQPVVWITTQIVEASLDIDFDVLFTELSDLNGLFQRLGRCNRQGKKPVLQPNCYVFTEIEQNLLQKKNSTRGFIDAGIYQLSKQAIKGMSGIISEADKSKLIADTLTTEHLKRTESNFLYQYGQVYRYIAELYMGQLVSNDVKIKMRNILTYQAIPLTIYQQYQEQIDELVAIVGQSSIACKEELSLWRRNRTKAKDQLMQYTVSVGMYDTQIITKRIKVGKYEEILVLDCRYGELGFQRWSAQEVKQRNETYEVTSDSFDAFL